VGEGTCTDTTETAQTMDREVDLIIDCINLVVKAMVNIQPTMKSPKNPNLKISNLRIFRITDEISSGDTMIDGMPSP